MLKLETPYLAQATYLLQFKAPKLKVRFDQAAAEEAFAPLVGTQSQQTNVPDQLDPNVPRIVFPSEKKQITISQVQCQLECNFPGAEMGIQKQLGVTSKNVLDFHTRALRFKNADEFGLTAISLQFNFPSHEKTQSLQQFIYDNYVKISPIGEVASAQIQLGFSIDGHFFNLFANAYEKRAINITPQFGETHRVMNMAEMPIIEQGIGVKLEVNNKPSAESIKDIIVGDPQRLLDLCSAFIDKNFEKVTGLALNGSRT
ncbi:hypothetical protein PO002_04920 [Cupriavidus necator]|uniref:hypothetical protein n=1 Tax=Cupriavidus necator TaxID=106590 RepID=UPI0039C0A4E2